MGGVERVGRLAGICSEDLTKEPLPEKRRRAQSRAAAGGGAATGRPARRRRGHHGRHRRRRRRRQGHPVPPVRQPVRPDDGAARRRRDGPASRHFFSARRRWVPTRRRWSGSSRSAGSGMRFVHTHRELLSAANRDPQTRYVGAAVGATHACAGAVAGRAAPPAIWISRPTRCWPCLMSTMSSINSPRAAIPSESLGDAWESLARKLCGR